MPSSPILTVFSVFLLSISIARANDPGTVNDGTATPAQWESARQAFEALSQFQGNWQGTGNGKWGKSDTEQTISSVLAGRAICRSGFSVYPPQEKNPAGEEHRAVSLIALVDDGERLTLAEYDNEGFIAHYVLDMGASETGKSWVFVLERGDNLPPQLRARLTIRAPEGDHLVETFELDFDGSGYALYLTSHMERSPGQPVSHGCRVQ